MKKFLVAGIAAAAFCGAPAFAADMPVKALAYKTVDPGYNWTGFYIGIEGGWARFDSRVDAISGGAFLTTGPLHKSGGIIGGTVGYNWQNGPWVAGVEGDLSWTDLRVTNNTAPNCAPGNPGTHCTNKLDWLGTARVRGGYTVMNNTMIYATGGAAFGRVGSNLNFGGVAPPVGAIKTETGWTVGGGVESMINPHWTVKAEYLYVDLGKVPTFLNGVALFNPDVKARVNVLRAGLNYKF